ncbi:hypothetical protein JB92DRAFT_3206878 [Gautieria morchelliformis]|nr:hypothetical protein JB92DRAFT_3206878 [Gautieria morchelliformis]
MPVPIFLTMLSCSAPSMSQAQGVVMCMGKPSSLSLQSQGDTPMLGHSYAAWYLWPIGHLWAGVTDAAAWLMSLSIVEFGGHTMYGGFGKFARIGAVVGQGRICRSKSSQPGRTLRGWPSFSLVTAWTYQALPGPPTTIHYVITVELLSVPEIAAAYVAWEAFATTVPNELATAALFGAIPGQLGRSQFILTTQPDSNAGEAGTGAASGVPVGTLAVAAGVCGGGGGADESRSHTLHARGARWPGHLRCEAEVNRLVQEHGARGRGRGQQVREDGDERQERGGRGVCGEVVDEQREEEEEEGLAGEKGVGRLPYD